MARVLITGMSGTGKSTMIERLAARGLTAVDTDSDDWCEWRPDPDTGEPDWVWREDRIGRLLDDHETLIVSGCKANQGQFYPRFDSVVVLTAAEDVMRDRILARSSNPYGKNAEEWERIRQDKAEIEPLLLAGADHALDTDRPIEELVVIIEGLASDHR